jgi:hypothetical protein
MPPAESLDLASVEVLAFLIWERDGFPEGQHLEHWLEAESLMLAGSQDKEPSDNA